MVWRVGIGSVLAVAALAATASAPASADVGFSPGTPITGLNVPNGATTADVNRDGDLDVVVPNFGVGAMTPGSVSVHRGDGGNTWVPNAIALGPLLQPTDVAVGRLNVDEDLDFITGNFTSPGQISEFLGDGAGGGSALSTTVTGDGVDDLVLVDADDDGDLDVVMANRIPNQVTTALNNGAGMFPAQAVAPVAAMPSQLDLGDVDEDGRPDLAVSHLSSGSSILIGTGNAATPFVDPHGGSILYTLGAYRDVELADLDGDDHLDIVSAGNGVAAALGDGNAEFGGPRVTPPGIAGANNIGLAIGDLDADGHPDAVVADFNADLVRVLHNAGAGFFTAAATIPVADPVHPAIADIDRDGALDLLLPSTSGNSVVLRLNRAVVEAADVDFGGQVTGGPGPIDQVVFENAGGAPLNAGIAAIAGTNPTDFTIVGDDCSGTQVAAGGNCAIAIRFTPGTVGPRDAILTLPGDAAAGDAIVNLDGRGIDPVTGAPGAAGGTGSQGASAATPAVTPVPKKCRKGRKLKQGKCVKKRK